MPPSPKVPALPGVERSIHPFPNANGLLDGGVADGVDSDLQPREMGVVKELREFVVVSIQNPGSRDVDVRFGDGCGAGSERTVQKEIAADALQSRVDDERDVHVGDVRHDVHG